VTGITDYPARRKQQRIVARGVGLRRCENCIQIGGADRFRTHQGE
jgi:hypothetical protein